MRPRKNEMRETRELFLKAHQGDQKARDQLILMYRYLAKECGRQYASRGEPVEDLVQIAIIGLINAVDRFDPNRGTKFITYAIPTIIGEIKRYFRDHAWVIKPPRDLRDLRQKIQRIEESLTQKLKHTPTPSEIADYLGETEERILEAMSIGNSFRPLSLGISIQQEDSDDEITLEDAIAEQKPPIEDTVSIREALRSLDPASRALIGLQTLYGRTQLQISRKIGYSQMHVSRLTTRAKAGLRAALG